MLRSPTVGCDNGAGRNFWPVYGIGASPTPWRIWIATNFSCNFGGLESLQQLGILQVDHIHPLKWAGWSHISVCGQVDVRPAVVSDPGTRWSVASGIMIAQLARPWTTTIAVPSLKLSAGRVVSEVDSNDILYFFFRLFHFPNLFPSTRFVFQTPSPFSFPGFLFVIISSHVPIIDGLIDWYAQEGDLTSVRSSALREGRWDLVEGDSLSRNSFGPLLR